MMRPILNGLAASVVSALALTATGVEAQNTPILDRLITGSAIIKPLPQIDVTTRASKRYAVVIGNSDYKDIPDLPNANTDADVVAEFLRGQGYLVAQHNDITKAGFEDVLRRILFDVDKDTEVVVYYAGHGFQIGSENYLVPVDANLDSVYDVQFEAVSLSSLVGIVGARARLQVVILDSCRDNPFAGKSAINSLGNTLRETRTGFSSQAAPLNSMLVYSTAPGAVAFDGEGDNSPFTASLIEVASNEPDAQVKEVFEDVRRLTFNRTNGRQVPWDSSTLVEPASFGIGAALARPISVSSIGTGVGRGLAFVGEADDLVVEASQDVETTAIINADFVPEVEIGFALSNALDLTDTDSVTLTKRPETGRLMLTDETGLRRDVTGETLSTAQVRDLILVNESVQIPAKTLDTATLSDAMTVEVNGTARGILMQLSLDPCDYEAGDHLDPDGMGITRYASEVNPARALAACEDAVARNPEVGRFHYQLGRALRANSRTEDAKVALTRARDLGHARAWNTLGVIATLEELGIGRTRARVSDEVLQLFARGAEQGDPYSYQSLGRELLSYPDNTAMEIEGYDLIVRAMEVGHTFSMNSLSGLYLDEESDYYDPERGLRYMRESAARGDVYGMNNLGRALMQGRGGLTIDYDAAYALLVRASEGGHPTAPFEVATLYRDGHAPGGINMSKAIDWFAIGLDRGDAVSGAFAAYYLQVQPIEGYTIYDGAVLAARGAVMDNEGDAEYAITQMNSMSAQTFDGGTQKLINILGGNVTVDGNFGPASEAALAEVLARYGQSLQTNDPRERLLQLARVYLAQNPIRTDIY